MFPIIIGLSVEISDNPTKRLAYFLFCGNPLQRFELHEAIIEKRENLHFSRPRLDYKLSENKQGLRSITLDMAPHGTNICKKALEFYHLLYYGAQAG